MGERAIFWPLKLVRVTNILRTTRIRMFLSGICAVISYMCWYVLSLVLKLMILIMITFLSVT